MLNTSLRSFLLPALALALLTACGGPHSDTKNGALIGAGTGAAAGAIIGNDDVEGAAIGGLAGAVVGGFIGHLEEHDR